MVEQDEALESAERARRIAALKGSLGRLQLITPELCENYLRAWAADRQRWQRDQQKSLIRSIQQLSGLEQRLHAVAALSWPGAPRLTWESSAQGSLLEPDSQPHDRQEPEAALAVAARSE